MQLRSGKRLYSYANAPECNFRRKTSSVKDSYPAYVNQKKALMEIIRRFITIHLKKAQEFRGEVKRFKETTRVIHELYFIIRENLSFLLKNPELHRLARVIRVKAFEFIDEIVDKITYDDYYVENMSRSDFANQLNLKRILQEVADAIPSKL